ncbi:MAG TPA: hypothetical protein VF826_04980 [Chloroflexia bacterium]
MAISRLCGGGEDRGLRQRKKVRSPQARDSQTFHGEETCVKGSTAAPGRAELSTVL